MARTSRKNIMETVNTSKAYRAAAYVRLSVVKPNESSDSIENQKKLIRDYVEKRDDIEIQAFYSDENSNGTSFERKGFQKMLSDIYLGKIDCVVVKDLSRFGRNAIETGFYIQQVFPEKGIRFIAINDRFDTVDGTTDLTFDGGTGIRIPITNILNEEFVADIRRKQQASIDTQIREGKYVAPRAPYGYIKSSADCHQLIPDPEAMVVVKEIFSLAHQGISISEIVRRLNLAHIPTPIDYAISKGLEGSYEHGDGSWNSSSVKYILTNRTYTGDLQQGEKGILVENTHGALVSRDVFLQIQQSCFRNIDTSKSASKTPAPENPLKGKVFCATCGGKMQRRKGGNSGLYFFSCITNNRKGSGCDTGMYIREADIMTQVKDAFVQENSSATTPTSADLAAFICEAVREIVVWSYVNI
ncbi:recombinase family protein [Megasphaera cerevisiae]|uniref:recombinase family protein n=1 Tax=Megasphaera cerevisiae TaxID=39029 RepID=UPI00065ADDC8|nr:recombinase family protein [Megasphaera cerevisiae]SKA09925.1 Site-specific DNA recombinase [Megasphaera cerevisiae DSM 20462]